MPWKDQLPAHPAVELRANRDASSYRSAIRHESNWLLAFRHAEARAYLAGRVSLNSERPEPHLEPVVDQELVRQDVAHAENVFDRLSRLKRTDDRLGNSDDGEFVLWSSAPVETCQAGRVPRHNSSQPAFETEYRPVDERNTVLKCGHIEEEPGFKVVRAVENDIETGGEA